MYADSILLIIIVAIIILTIKFFKMDDSKYKKVLRIILKIVYSVILYFISSVVFFIMTFSSSVINKSIIYLISFIPMLFILPLWIKKYRKKLFILIGVYIIIAIAVFFTFVVGIIRDRAVTIDTSVNIDTYEYMPFVENTKIVKLNHDASLRFMDNFPILDGAAAAFPIYSAFVNAVYPSIIEFGKKPFLYSNTIGGYEKLSEKKIDIFFGAYPSDEQLEMAKKNNTEFEFTEIGKEGFVFFVNSNNPVDSLTSQQLKDIYSGKITNWKEVGGKNQIIKAFQRNEGSGSQSMLIRFMDGTELMDAPTEDINSFMDGIITTVADYRNYENSIGFSFRYYLDTLIANPNVKMLKVDGVEPTQENITNGTYPIITFLYAVTYKDNPNKNVAKLIEWILSDEGQEIIYKTGYARVK